MLVLSRHENERIFIGEDIVVTIIEIRGERVRIGIEAPNGVKIDREEVYEKIKQIGFDTRKMNSNNINN